MQIERHYLSTVNVPIVSTVLFISSNESGRSSINWLKMKMQNENPVLQLLYSNFLYLSMYPQTKKSRGLRSGLCAGHTTDALREMTRFWNLVLRNCKFASVVWLLAPSCCHHQPFLATRPLMAGQTLLL